MKEIERQETEEKTRRTELAKGKAEQETLQHRKKKKQLLGINKEGDETCGTDALPEVLQSGKRIPRNQDKASAFGKVMLSPQWSYRI